MKEQDQIKEEINNIREMVIKFAEPYVEEYKECVFNIIENFAKSGSDDSYLAFEFKTLNTSRIDIWIDVTIFYESKEIVISNCPDKLRKEIRDYLMGDDIVLKIYK